MWASPSKIPINISLISSCIFIEALSDFYKRSIPFIELASNNIKLKLKNKK